MVYGSSRKRPSTISRPPWVGIASVLLVATAARAHEFWIEPSSFTPRPGELVKLELRVGERFAGEAVPRNEAWIERFDAVRDGASTRVLGVDGSDPAGLLRPDREGEVVVAYGGTPAYVEVDAVKFEAYLEAEGLDAPRAERARSHATAAPGRERFSRCAKALLAVGGRLGRGAVTPVGLTLELVPESDPYALRPGSPLTVRLLYRGKPLSRVLVKAMDRGAGSPPPLASRTDAAGRATFRLPRAGAWLIHAVHMVPSREDPRADWESFWASLTLGLTAGS